MKVVKTLLCIYQDMEIIVHAVKKIIGKFIKV